VITKGGRYHARKSQRGRLALWEQMVAELCILEKAETHICKVGGHASKGRERHISTALDSELGIRRLRKETPGGRPFAGERDSSRGSTSKRRGVRGSRDRGGETEEKSGVASFEGKECTPLGNNYHSKLQNMKKDRKGLPGYAEKAEENGEERLRA